ncbi:MAG TPA: hypothetical protein VGI66_12345 [Streptosporangiaceae bacterium]
MNSAEIWPEPVGYGRAAAHAWSVVVDEPRGLAGNRYPGSIDYNNAPRRAGRAAGAEERDWQEWEEWQHPEWGPPPELHPDHPSAPVPRVWLPDDHPSGPMPVPRAPGAKGRPGLHGSGPSPRGPGRTRIPGRHDSVTTTATVGYLTVHHEVSGFRRQRSPAGPGVTTQQRPADPGLPEYTGYVREADPSGPGTGPATEWFEDDSPLDSDQLWMAGQVLTLADDKAAQVAHDAEAEAAAIREAARREADAIRETAQREAAELRAQLNSMLGELNRITAYLADPAIAAIAPARPATAPAMPATAPFAPAAAPAAMPVTAPALRPTTRPATRPARPGASPATKPAGRQAKVMRKFTAAFAVVSVLGALAGGAELALHGLPFFIFRANGAGASVTGPREPANPPKTGQPFPQGKHHRPAAHQQPTTTTK